MLTKAILAKELRKPGLSYRDASVYLDVLLDTIVEALSKGESIQLRKLGTFDVKVTPEKKYPSLLSGGKVVPAHGRIIFRPSRELKEAIWKCGKDK